MPITSKKLFAGQPGTSEVTLYTVPSATYTLVKEIWLSNTTAATALISLSIVNNSGSASAANRILQNKVIPANDVVLIACSQHMDAGDFISGLQVSSGAIYVRICGVEVV